MAGKERVPRTQRRLNRPAGGCRPVEKLVELKTVFEITCSKDRSVGSCEVFFNSLNA